MNSDDEWANFNCFDLQNQQYRYEGETNGLEYMQVSYTLKRYV